MSRRVSRRGVLALLGSAALAGCGADAPHVTETPEPSAGSLAVPSGADAWPTNGADGGNSYANSDARGPADGVDSVDRYGDFGSVSLSAVVDRVAYGVIDDRLAAFSFADGTVRWRGPEVGYDPPVFVTERFVFSEGGAALDRETGERVWEPPNTENGWSFDGRAGVGIVDGTLVGIDGADATSLGDGGKRRWRTEWDDGANARYTGTVSAAFDDARVVRVGATDVRPGDGDESSRPYDHSRVTVLDAAGSELFRFQTAGRIGARRSAASPTLDRGRLYLPVTVWNLEQGSDGGSWHPLLGHLYSLDAETGELSRRKQYEGTELTALAVADGDPIVATDEGLIDRRWGPGTDTDGWTTTIDHEVGRIAAGDGVIYALAHGDEASFLYCLDGATGGRRWRRELDGDVDTTWLALCGNRLYLTGHGGSLFELRG